MSTSSVAAVTTQSASATPAASASSRPSAPAEGQPPALATNPPASAGPSASARSTEEGFSNNAPTPRILILRSSEKPLASLSPFHRRDGCDRFGKVKRCERMRDGGIEVEFERCEDAARAMNANRFVYSKRDSSGRKDVFLPMTVETHRTKNFSRGVIFCFDLEGVSDGEIEEGLAGFGVIAARRIRTRRGGELAPTHSVILTFNSTDLPREVKVGYLSVKVRPYVPAPMRCFRCLRFGHTRDSCRNRPTCGKCAATDHTSDDCSAETIRCVNCDGTQTPHTAFDRQCPAYMREKEILSLKVTERLTFREARDRYNATHPKRSYASVAAGPKPNRPLDQAQNSNIHQLMTLLQSFGLRLVANSGDMSGMSSTTTQQTASASTSVATQTSPPGAGEVEHPDQEGWTLVRGSRGTRSPRPVPSSSGNTTSSSAPTATRAGGTAATEALRRAEEDRKAREAKRARLLEKAKGVKESKGSEEVSPARDSASPSSDTLMGPPAPPPPRCPPSSSGSFGGEGPEATPPSSPRFLQPPPTPGRPAKRNMAWSGSPTDTETPRSRHKAQPNQRAGRSSSADGGLSRSQLVHPRVQFHGSSTIAGQSDRV